ncbi:MAG TPA: UDP-N-acetylmuramoyl-L-alanyl-D-glutamate--2,6-diaminopimelate ligase [Candidatus Saccharimonadia bacterium]|jgi:UDP-N-acetylmuramoyl-L-alanyl-D-glutamate--2,6-diaminopimelate ligase
MFRKLVKAVLPQEFFKAVEPTGHLLEAVLWQVVEGFPARGLNVIGVTGTDGKTTTCAMIYEMLNDAGIKTGLMSTVGWGTPENWREQQVHMTTMPTRAMLRRIKQLRAEGIKWLVLETTSHALAQGRVWGMPYSVVAMTNVTHEHLDYHGTFERYREAKVKLFRMAGANERGLRLGVVNADDPSAPYFAAAIPRVLRYAVKQAQADLKASDVKSSPDGNEYELRYEGETVHVRVALPGSFNVYNSMAAAGVGLAVGLSPSRVVKGLEALKTVEGRMNKIEEGQDFSVIVDFAHTPESFEKILSSFRKLTKGRLIVMFGSAGRRDESKRGKQGASAGKYADLVVVTEEDDRDVDGIQIMNQIAAGAETEGKVRERDLFLVHDRTKAIKFAVNRAKPGDTVLLLGKGHEKTIERADGEHPWDEAGTVRAALRELKVGKKRA